MAEIRKTISQARYGSNAEMGRAWRGPEKKDRKAPTVAAGAGLVGVGGGAAAIAGKRRLRDVGPEVKAAPARDTVPLKATHTTALGEASTHAAARGAAEGQLEGMKRQHANWVDSGRKREHPLKGQPAPGHPGRGQAPAGKVGPKGGGIKHHQGIYEGRFGEADRNWSAADRKAADAARTLKGAEAHNAGRHAAAETANKGRNATIKGSKRLIRGGGAVAGLGGLAAVGAGIKAERDRKTGFGKPKRRTSLVQVRTAQQRANGL
jgi:hypothetical protein